MEAMFPNGSVKRVGPATVRVAVVSRYRECLRNHAMFTGGHAIDGCGAYLPSLELNPDPATFMCVACGCHRNFHRQEMVVEPSPPPPPPSPAQHQVALLPAPPMATSIVLHGLPQREEHKPEDRLPAADSQSDSDGSEYVDGRSVSPPQLQQAPPAHLPAPVAPQPPAYFSPPPQPNMLLSLNATAPPGAAQSQSPLPVQDSPAMAPPAPAHVGGAPRRKRSRTMFTAEQKHRMKELSERLGWRQQKRDEATMDEWCRDIGVSKGVFKVWMHNNKRNYVGGNSARRRALATAASSAATTPAAGPIQIAPTTAASPPPAPFIPSVTHSSPAPTATGFNMNGTATPAFTAATK